MGSDRKEKKDKKKDKRKKSKHDKTESERRDRKRARDEENSSESFEKSSLSVSDTNKLREKLGLKPLEEEPAKVDEADKNVVSLSVEETNKLRASLGLKPLDVSTKSDGDVHVPAKNIGKITEAEKLAEKMKTLKEKRRIKQQLNRVKSLGSTSVDLTDTLAWVDRSRKMEAKKVLAEARTKLLDSMDDEFGVGELIENEKPSFKSQYSSKDLRDLTVTHDVDAFTEGKVTILTLQDKEILGEDQEDALENVNIAEDERTNKNVELKKKKPDYNPYMDDYDEDGNYKPQNMLSKYDEVIEGEKKKSFKLAEVVSTEEVKRKLAEGLPMIRKSNSESLDFSSLKKTASEYYSAEEVAAFKKPRKRRKKLRKTTIDDIVPLPNDLSLSNDHGSRSNRDKRAKGTEKYVKQDTEENMELDIDDTVPESKKSTKNRGKISERELYSGNFADLDDDDSELQAALTRARRSNLQERKVIDVAETVSSIKSQKESIPGVSKTSKIVLDITEEFAKNIGSGEQEEEEQPEVMKLDTPTEPKKTSEWKDVDMITAQFGEFQDYDPDAQQDVIEAEPLLQRGLSGALQVAQRKGFIEETKEAANSVDINDAIKPVGKLRARFFQLDRETGQDMDSRRRSERDYGSFPEKRDYNPDVKIVYTDNVGRELDSKEAFRQLSHKFHGKGSGKTKTEKRMKKTLEQMALKKMDSDDTPLGSAALLREKQKEANTSYIVLSGGNRIPSDVHNTLSKISKR